MLCTASDSRLRSRIVAAGVVQPLLQLAIVGSPPTVQGPVYEALQVCPYAEGLSPWPVIWISLPVWSTNRLNYLRMECIISETVREAKGSQFD